MNTRGKRLVILALLTTAVAGGGAGVALLRVGSGDPQTYSRIEDGLYLGSAVKDPPPGTRAVVNLCGRLDPYQVGPSLWMPIYEAGADGAQQEPTLDVLRRVVGFIDEQRRAGRTTYVHCMLGQNRSAAVVAAYLMQNHGMGRNEALSVLQRRRPIVKLDPTLMTLLSEWEQLLKGAR